MYSLNIPSLLAIKLKIIFLKKAPKRTTSVESSHCTPLISDSGLLRNHCSPVARRIPESRPWSPVGSGAAALGACPLAWCSRSRLLKAGAEWAEPSNPSSESTEVGKGVDGRDVVGIGRYVYDTL